LVQGDCRGHIQGCGEGRRAHASHIGSHVIHCDRCIRHANRVATLRAAAWREREVSGANHRRVDGLETATTVNVDTTARATIATSIEAAQNTEAIIVEIVLHQRQVGVANEECHTQVELDTTSARLGISGDNKGRQVEGLLTGSIVESA
jgi:hypothetical protein